jgi:hypothetical protein
MKKYIAVVVSAGALAAALIVPAGASATPSESSPAFAPTTTLPCPKSGSVANVHNEALRFSTDTSNAIAIPGVAGEHANENSAVSPYGGACGTGGIVHPPGYTD